MYKEHKIVMLPSEDKSINQLIKNKYTNKLSICKQLNADDESSWEYQNLYILSDEEIRENDWFINELNQVWQHNGKVQPSIKSKKIISTTNKSLSWIEHDDTVPYPKGKQYFVPQIPQYFIEYFISEYNKGNVIDKVEVGYEIGNWEHETSVHRKCVNCGTSNHKLDAYNCKCTNTLKVNPDNIINIKPIKTSWNREEIIEILKKREHHIAINMPLNCKMLELKDWIKDNL